MVGRAIEVQALTLHLEDLRPHGLGKHRNVDDTPYGGGSGMVLRVDPVVHALEAADQLAEAAGTPQAHRVLLTPRGARFDQRAAHRLCELPHVALVCGRYEGFDERTRHFVHEELSLGDFVMTGGEIAAMAIVEATARLLPNVLGNERSHGSESFSPELDGGLEYPHYTRPVEFRGHSVPAVLTSGDHAKIAAWRREESRLRTRAVRPDLATPVDPEES
jgi:tRNA (guanine37-N1)-methyltransferase